jgi:hypothetical protein
MQKHDGLAVRLVGMHVHVSHKQRLALGEEFVALNRVWIVEIGEKRIGACRSKARQCERRAN